MNKDFTRGGGIMGAAGRAVYSARPRSAQENMQRATGVAAPPETVSPNASPDEILAARQRAKAARSGAASSILTSRASGLL